MIPWFFSTFCGKNINFLGKWVMSRIERSYENCEIYDISQDHWQSLRYLFKGLLGSPVQSYENCENYEIYENCEIYDNLQDHWQSLRNLFKGLQGSPVQSYEDCENYEIYGWKNEPGIFMVFIYSYYVNYDHCSFRETWLSRVGGKPRPKLRELRKLQNLRKVRNLRKMVKFVTAFNPGHKWGKCH